MYIMTPPVWTSCRKSNPEVLEKRKQRVQELDADVNRMQSRNPGRVPDWDEERLMRMDKAALQHGKRCVMWDDTGAGFYLVRNAHVIDLNIPGYLLSPYS